MVRALRSLAWVAALLVAWFALISPGADRLAGMSDALWWQLLPWALLVVFWVVVLRQLRRRPRPADTGPGR